MSGRSGKGDTATTGNGHGEARRITRDDLEAKFRELQGEVDQGVEAAKGVGLVVGVAAVVFAIVAAYWLGRRRGRKRQMVVEVRRI